MTTAKPTENWKMISGYSTYMISDHGKVLSLPNRKRKTSRLLSASPDRDGYLTVMLSNNGKARREKIHQLVANNFIRPRMEGEEIDHINNDKKDNRHFNLRWVSHTANMKKMIRENDLSKAHNHLKKPVVCVETGKFYHCLHDAARKTGIVRSSIKACCVDNHRTAGGYHWKFQKEI